MGSMKNKVYFLSVVGLIAIMCVQLAHSEPSSKGKAEVAKECDNKTVSKIIEEIDTTTDEVATATVESEPKAAVFIKEESMAALKLNDELPKSGTDCRFAIGEEVPLPSLSTEPKLFTDYRCYNLPYTPHYRLQQVAYTDDNGLRRFNEDYIVGLGAFYSESIGDRFQIALDTGFEFTIILGDGKAPCDCDAENMYTPCVNYDGENCANVLEFIVDNYAMHPKVYAYGSIDFMDKFKGNISKMVYLGRDSSANWDLYE